MTFEEYCQKQKEENEAKLYREGLKSQLVSLTQDIMQSLVGEAVPNIEARKEKFIQIHNELRVLEGKEPREIWEDLE